MPYTLHYRVPFPVMLCSPEKRTLGKMKALISQRLEASDQERVLFFQLDELFSYLEEAGPEAGEEERTKDCK